MVCEVTFALIMDRVSLQLHKTQFILFIFIVKFHSEIWKTPKASNQTPLLEKTIYFTIFNKILK